MGEDSVINTWKVSTRLRGILSVSQQSSFSTGWLCSLLSIADALYSCIQGNWSHSWQEKSLFIEKIKKPIGLLTPFLLPRLTLFIQELCTVTQTWIFLSIYNSSIILVWKHRESYRTHLGSETRTQAPCMRLSLALVGPHHRLEMPTFKYSQEKSHDTERAKKCMHALRKEKTV